MPARRRGQRDTQPEVPAGQFSLLGDVGEVAKGDAGDAVAVVVEARRSPDEAPSQAYVSGAELDRIVAAVYAKYGRGK